MYEEYSIMEERLKRNKIGAILQNLRREQEDLRSNEIRDSYVWRINNIETCRSFFLWIFRVTEGQLKGLQNCVKNKIGFDLKSKGNHKILKEL